MLVLSTRQFQCIGKINENVAPDFKSRATFKEDTMLSKSIDYKPFAQLAKVTLIDRNNFTKIIETNLIDHNYWYMHCPKKQMSFFLGNPQLDSATPFRKIVCFKFIKKECGEYLYREIVTGK